MNKWLWVTLSLFCGLVLTLSVLCAVYIDNKNVQYQVFRPKTPEQGEIGIKIMHLSDLHFPTVKVNVDKLVARIFAEQPDIIAITGDIVSTNSNMATCGVFQFIDRITPIAPVYYVNGNHEADNSQQDTLYDYLESAGVVFLQDQSVTLTFNGRKVTIVGLLDNADYNESCLTSDIEDSYIVLLAHRPKKWISYVSNPDAEAPNLVLTGHVHGGQFRIFGQGLISPSREFFPKYDAGLYNSKNEKGSQMILSRGIGASVAAFPRFNNKPHVPIIMV